MLLPGSIAGRAMQARFGRHVTKGTLRTGTSFGSKMLMSLHRTFHVCGTKKALVKISAA